MCTCVMQSVFYRTARTHTHMASHRPCTVEEIFIDFRARRTAVIRALTHDVDKFYKLCDPGKDNLCLYGHPNATWEVKLPAEEVPPELPEPALGINFARDDVDRRDWLSLVAVHSDSWLISVAFYLAAHLNHNQRKRLFNLISDLPTLLEVVTDRKPVKDKPTVDRGITEVIAQVVNEKLSCGCCGGKYNAEEFWIGCDMCEWWFHGRCIMITPANAETLKQYKCASCALRKGKP